MPYWTQAELARVARVGRAAVAQAVRDGALATVETSGGTPLIHRDEAERWLRKRRPRNAEKPGSKQPRKVAGK